MSFVSDITERDDPMVRENLVIMDVVTTKFNKRKHVQISKSLAILLILLFIGCLVATGLLVYNFSSCSGVSQVESPEILCQNGVELPLTTEVVEIETESVTTPVPTTTEVAKTDSPEDSDVRLPTSIVPHSYKLKLIPFLQEGNFTFQGEVQILVNVTSTTSNITLHADELLIDSVSVTDAEGKSVSIIAARDIKRKQFLVIDLAEEIAAKNQYYVYLTFKGVLNDLLQGFYRSSYQENNETR